MAQNCVNGCVYINKKDKKIKRKTIVKCCIEICGKYICKDCRLVCENCSGKYCKISC